MFPFETKRDLLDMEKRLKAFILLTVSPDTTALAEFTKQLKQNDDDLKAAVDKQKDK